jgi:hypothetical protein
MRGRDINFEKDLVKLDIKKWINYQFDVFLEAF